MSARTASPIPPQTVDELRASIDAEQLLRTEIANCLRQINSNSKRAGRFFGLVFKGISHNDREFVPVVLYEMFGLQQVRGKLTAVPMHPEFDYQGRVRAMSRHQLYKLLQKYKAGYLSKKQLRRVFEGFEAKGLLTCTVIKGQDRQGYWNTRVLYTFNLEAWYAVWEETRKTPRVRRGKSQIKTGKVSSLDKCVTKAHRPVFRAVKKEAVISSAARVENQPKPLVFPGPPEALPGPVFSLKKGPAPSAASGRHVSSAPASAGPCLRPLGREKEKGAAAPSGFPSSFKTVSKSPAQARKGNRFPEDMPSWQIFLEGWLDSGSSKKVGDNWREDLHLLENPEKPELKLKPRTPDCLVNPVATPGNPRGVWSMQKEFLPLTPAALELADLVERITGCPLRMKDWESLVDQMSRSNFCRLTKDRLLLTIYAVVHSLDMEFGVSLSSNEQILETMRDPQLTIFGVVPELQDANFGDYFYTLAMSDVYRTDADCEGAAEQARKLLPFLHFRTASPLALLSPDNAGKLLAGWYGLYQRLVSPPKRKLQPGGRLELWEKTEAQRSVEHATMADMSAPIYQLSPEDFGNILLTEVLGPLEEGCYSQTLYWASVFAFAKQQGLARLAPAALNQLRKAALLIFCHAPNHWTELDNWLGGGFLQQVCPLSDWSAARESAQSRTRQMLVDRWELPYKDFKPSEHIG